MEIVDDFIRDQLADCQSLHEMCVEIDKAKARATQLDKEYHIKSVNYTNVDRRQVGVKKTKQAK